MNSMNSMNLFHGVSPVPTEADRLRKQLWTERIFFGLVIIALLSVIYFSRPLGPRIYAVEVGGEPKVYLPSSSLADKVQSALRDELKQQYGENVSLPEMKVSAQPASDEHKPTTETDALDRLRREIKPQVKAAAIYINGKPVLALRDRADAETALDQAKSALLKREEQSTLPLKQPPPQIDPAAARFKEKVEIKEASVNVDLLKPSVKDALRLLLGSANGGKKPYVVQQRDTGVSIAKQLKMSFNKLSQLNPGVKWNRLQIGQELNVTETKPLLTIVVTRELTWAIDVPYSLEEVESSELPPGAVKVQRRGQWGKKEITARITYENGREVTRKVIRETVLRPAVRQVVLMSTR
jgi:LysM repeat protein